MKIPKKEQPSETIRMMVANVETYEIPEGEPVVLSQFSKIKSQGEWNRLKACEEEAKINHLEPMHVIRIRPDEPKRMEEPGYIPIRDHYYIYTTSTRAQMFRKNYSCCTMPGMI